ncbi:phosphopantetheine-binding protein, partial [Bacillus cereus]|uniref:AMP-binding enzyme n=1 Tax=Bacillus cereus TaxID=1396 RepID=UPI0036723908
EIRVSDLESGVELDAGQRGEVWLRGPTVMSGYRHDQLATAAAFAGPWFRTGDVGYLDEDGFLYLVDRIKDVIIVGGENVYSAEVEQVLALYPGVTDIAVVGVQNEREGESVVAVVVCRDGVRPTLADLRRYASALLAPYKLPSRVVHAEHLPRNAMGKISKPEIRASVSLGTRGVRPGAHRGDYRGIFASVCDAIAQTIGGVPPVLDPQDRLLDIGLGSLAAVELSRRLAATFGLELPRTVLFDHATIGALAQYIHERVAEAPAPHPVLTRLDELERALAAEPLSPAVRTAVRTRGRALLNRIGSPTLADALPASAVVDASDDAELFALIDRHLAARAGQS